MGLEGFPLVITIWGTKKICNIFKEFKHTKAYWCICLFVLKVKPSGYLWRLLGHRLIKHIQVYLFILKVKPSGYLWRLLGHQFIDVV